MESISAMHRPIRFLSIRVIGFGAGSTTFRGSRVRLHIPTKTLYFVLLGNGHRPATLWGSRVRLHIPTKQTLFIIIRVSLDFLCNQECYRTNLNIISSCNLVHNARIQRILLLKHKIICYSGLKITRSYI